MGPDGSTLHMALLAVWDGDYVSAISTLLHPVVARNMTCRGGGNFLGQVILLRIRHDMHKYLSVLDNASNGGDGNGSGNDNGDGNGGGNNCDDDNDSGHRHYNNILKSPKSTHHTTDELAFPHLKLYSKSEISSVLQRCEHQLT